MACACRAPNSQSTPHEAMLDGVSAGSFMASLKHFHVPSETKSHINFPGLKSKARPV